MIRTFGSGWLSVRNLFQNSDKEIRKQFAKDGVVLLKGVLDRQMAIRLTQAARELDLVHERMGDRVRNARFYSGTWPQAIEDIEYWPP